MSNVEMQLHVIVIAFMLLVLLTGFGFGYVTHALVTLHAKLDLKMDRVFDFSEALEEDSARYCVGCHCSETRACPGGCGWLVTGTLQGGTEVGVCTRCANTVDEAVELLNQHWPVAVAAA